ncbi:hypothetical protein Sme01_05140 [Sphaerisporangium melleum]|uniref:Uncharacterized protein n=1 Tax=Sphaerisporangium melleum TaxID=321316 RepID=A0A917QR51_9ACTN|nr:hypothetical protein [Sphaerisporangium melleum]GGK63037.1 hypothetical protein GCM10007964_02710 [Sphaerisporangium melleum]GII68038.1 hypothetical protein Sme01_05140 [Sphaerisporangium melleum]
MEAVVLEKLVGVHLFRLREAFRMSRECPDPEADAAVGEPAPAMLVLPREGPLREPHLMLFTGSRSFCAMPAGTLLSEGLHVVVHLDDGLGEAWHNVADVVVGAVRRAYPFPAHRVTRILDRYPGCEVATGRRRHGCLAGLRGGRLARITEVTGRQAAGAAPGPALYGSFLYGWLVAGLPLDCLTTASVVHGRYAARPDGAEPGSLEVGGRARISLTGSLSSQVWRRM